jgi:hypothetical protein
MGTVLFDYLADSIFFDEQALSAAKDDELAGELARYRDFTFENLDELSREVYARQSATKIFTGAGRPIDLKLLKQGAFYIEQFVLDDPLFRLTAIGPEHGRLISEYLGMRGDSPLQPRVAAAASLLKQMTPMIAADYVKILPVSYMFEPPARTPIYYSENFFEDILPPELMSFFQSNAEVRAMRRDGDAYIEDSSLYPTRAISVRFKNDGSEHVRTYMLWEQELVSFDELSGEATMRMIVPDELPHREQFEAWIRQSINRTAAQVHHAVALQMALTNDLKSAYLTQSPFTFELMQRLAPDADPSKMRSATTLLNVELPFVEDVNTETLMALRREEHEAFEHFRRTLDRRLRDLANIRDAEEQRLKADDVSAELIENAHDVGAVVNRSKKKLAADTTLAIAGLSAAVASGGWTLPVAITAAAAGFKAYQDYRGATDAPAYFLWKVLQQSKV